MQRPILLGLILVLLGDLLPKTKEVEGHYSFQFQFIGQRVFLRWTCAQGEMLKNLTLDGLRISMHSQAIRVHNELGNCLNTGDPNSCHDSTGITITFFPKNQPTKTTDNISNVTLKFIILREA